MTTTALLYKAVFPETGCAILAVKYPSGPVHTVFTVTGTSTDGLNSTVQARVTELPAVMTDGLLMMLTVGAGTGKEKMYTVNQARFNSLLQFKETSTEFELAVVMGPLSRLDMTVA